MMVPSGTGWSSRNARAAIAAEAMPLTNPGNPRASHLRGRVSTSGQGLVEFALAAIVLLTLLCAIFEFSWVFYNYVYLYNAVSKGARMGAVGANNSAVKAEVVGAVGGLPIPADTVSITVTTPSGQAVASTDRTTGNSIMVGETIPYEPITPLSRFVPAFSSQLLTGRAITRIEGQTVPLPP